MKWVLVKQFRVSHICMRYTLLGSMALSSSLFLSPQSPTGSENFAPGQISMWLCTTVVWSAGRWSSSMRCIFGILRYGVSTEYTFWFLVKSYSKLKQLTKRGNHFYLYWFAVLYINLTFHYVKHKFSGKSVMSYNLRWKIFILFCRVYGSLFWIKRVFPSYIVMAYC